MIPVIGCTLEIQAVWNYNMALHMVVEKGLQKH